MSKSHTGKILVMFILALGCCRGKKSAAAIEADTTKSIDSTYVALANVARTDVTINFRQFRLLYAGSSFYEPYEVFYSQEMYQAYRLENYPEAISYARKTIEKRFIDFEAHAVCWKSNLELGDTINAKYHEAIARGILQSILEPGNGHAPDDSAYLVIMVPEEYAVLSFFGLRLVKQALIEKNEHSFDQMIVEDPDQGKTDTIYFNVDLPIRWWKKSLGE